MARFIDPRRTVPYVLLADREKPEAARVVYTLGILSDTCWASVTEVSDKDWLGGRYGLELLREGLRGWAGPGAPGFGVDATLRPTSATLSQASPEDRVELARAIYNLNVLGDADAGK